MPCKPVCARCITAVEAGGQALQELAFCDADALPPGTNWDAVGTALIALAGRLRRQAASR